MNAVERVYQYSNERTVPQEAAYEDSKDTVSLPAGWPTQGQIDFDDVVMRCDRGCINIEFHIFIVLLLATDPVYPLF